MDGGPAVDLHWVGLQHNLINAERLRGTSTEAILQLLNYGMTGSDSGKECGKNEGPHCGGCWRGQAVSRLCKSTLSSLDKVV